MANPGGIGPQLAMAPRFSVLSPEMLDIVAFLDGREEDTVTVAGKLQT